MPKLYEYFGLVVYFYTNEHEPIHVHGSHQGAEHKAEIILLEGEVARVRFVRVAGKPPLPPARLKDFKTLVNRKANEIVKLWVDYFVMHKTIKTNIIRRRLK
jgi:hypothetical protein